MNRRYDFTGQVALVTGASSVWHWPPRTPSPRSRCLVRLADVTPAAVLDPTCDCSAPGSSADSSADEGGQTNELRSDGTDVRGPARSERGHGPQRGERSERP
jgi:hypothetical protein